MGIQKRTWNANNMTSQKRSEIGLPEQTLGDNKYIWGTYIEMAFHNFFVNMRHIYSMVFGEDIMDYARAHYIDDKDSQYWDEDFGNRPLVWEPMFSHLRKGTTDDNRAYGDPEKKEKARELIVRHFPIMDAAIEFTRGHKGYEQYDQIEILRSLSEVLRILRNVYSHHRISLWPDQIDCYAQTEGFIIGILGTAFLGGKRVVKKRFAFDDATMQCAEQYRFVTDRNRLDDHGKPIKEKKEISGYKYHLTERESKHISVFGLAFLCSLFLEKKYSKILTDRVHCIPKKDQAVINELIAVYRIRLHQEKLYVSKNTDALALDILTDLRRCPQELFDRLRPEDQRKFRVASDEEDDNGDNILMVRKQDRFVHLALKYIDDAKLFVDIRFQVSLGHYFFKFYDKYCIDNTGKARVRSLSKAVNGYGRISEIDKLREECWESTIRKHQDVHKNTAAEKPYVTDHHARYIINGNRIGMRIFTESPASYLPDLTPGGISNLPPTCWMSIYEIPSMMFLIHLRGASSVEELIKSTVANYNKFFTDVAEGVLQPQQDEEHLKAVLEERYNGLRICDVPTDMVNYLTGNVSHEYLSLEEHTRNLIETLIDQTQYKIKRFRELTKQVGTPGMNKFGKKNYARIMPGRLADFMAKDLTMFQPNDECKLTGLNFRIMQSMLAQYGHEVDEEKLSRMFLAAHILGAQNDSGCNPIMMRVWHRVRRPRNTEEMYKAYLEERLDYLQSCNDTDAKKLPFVKSEKIRWQDHDQEFYKAKASRYLHEKSNGAEYDKSLELPRGLFDAMIRKELSTIDTMAVDAADESKNIHYLIYGYFKKVMADDVQPYYETERTHPLLNILFRKTKRVDDRVYFTASELREALMRNTSNSLREATLRYVNKLWPIKKRTEEEDHVKRLLKNLKDSENTLKRLRIQDIILFLIAQKILMAEDENDSMRRKALNKIRLKHITEKDVLSQKVRFEVKVKSKNRCKKRIYQDDLKIKDYAQFYQFVNDRRMPTLLDHAPTVINKELIDKELEGYDRVHPTVLQEVFRYEKVHYDKTGDQTPKGFGEMVHADPEYDWQTRSRLREIRNSFAHCSYPPYPKIGAMAQAKQLPEKAIAISQTFKNDIEKKTKIE